MYKFITILSIMLFASSLNAQQIRYVDTGYILENIPQYQEAKTRLENQVKAWKVEIKNEQSAIQKSQLELENEKVILTPDKIKEKEQLIKTKIATLDQKIESKFGVNGESNTLRKNLVKPIQDQIWNAINTIAQKNRYDLIIDKNSSTTLIYSNAKYDITDKVIKELGLDKEKKNTSKDSKPQKINSGKRKDNTSKSNKRIK